MARRVLLHLRVPRSGAATLQDRLAPLEDPPSDHLEAAIASPLRRLGARVRRR